MFPEADVFMVNRSMTDMARFPSQLIFDPPEPLTWAATLAVVDMAIGVEASRVIEAEDNAGQSEGLTALDSPVLLSHMPLPLMYSASAKALFVTFVTLTVTVWPLKFIVAFILVHIPWQPVNLVQASHLYIPRFGTNMSL